ncbi:helix-turn-helix domain-containing protein [Zunongwangia sp.]|uniref:helix-turn-helix domain-containing protein n=1 Tax=Zunongwangia sp. TaxID=1965325 RepID=UPI003AA9503C
MKKSIPTYDICSLTSNERTVPDFAIFNLQDFFLKQCAAAEKPHRLAFYQLMFITEGKGVHLIDFENYDLNAGDIYFLAPGQVHRWKIDSSIKGYFLNFNESFFSSFLSKGDYLNEFSFFMANGYHSKLKGVEQLSRIELIFEEILKEFQSNREHKFDLIRVYLLELFIKADRSVGKICREWYESKHQFYHLRNFEKLIEEDFKKKHLPKEYAKLLNVTPNYLNALCKKIRGQSAGEMIRNRILLESKRLLINSSLSISEVAYQLNFKDNSYFSRFFKKYVGISPDDFRRHKIDL